MEQYRQRRWADMLKITDMTFAFGKKTIFKNFSIELKKGEILAVMGPSVRRRVLSSVLKLTPSF